MVVNSSNTSILTDDDEIECDREIDKITHLIDGDRKSPEPSGDIEFIVGEEGVTRIRVGGGEVEGVEFEEFEVEEGVVNVWVLLLICFN